MVCGICTHSYTHDEDLRREESVDVGVGVEEVLQMGSDYYSSKNNSDLSEVIRDFKFTHTDFFCRSRRRCISQVSHL